MKQFIILILLTSVVFCADAQGLEGGLKAGLNTSKLSTEIETYTPQTINNYQFGAFARINMGRLYIQPEAYYNTRSGGYVDQSLPSIVNSFELKTIDVPALIGIKIINQESLNLRILGGPVFSFLTDKSVKGQFSRDNLENSFFGWQYGVGVDFLFLTFDVRKEMYGKNFTPDFDTKNGTFIISLGFKLF